MEMERKRSNGASLLMWTLLAGLLSQNLVIPVMSTTIEDQKNYYSPDPHSGSPPKGSHRSPPSHGSGGGHGGTPPSHGGGSYTPTPSTPSGGNCGSPPHDPSPTPTTPVTPTPSTPSNPPSGGGGYYNSPPPTDGGGSPPTYGGGSPPTYGGGSPPTYGGGSPPTYGGDSPPTYGGDSPPSPISLSPPTTPIDPGTPTIPTPPYLPSPTPFTGTCNYWRTHPGIIWGLLGWWGTLGSAFGGTSFPGFGAGLTFPQALSNTRNDGLGALYREGTASFLNSLVNNRFPYTTKQVRDRFVTSLSSNKAAAAQAHLFKIANEGRMKPRT